jgi:hypothetical protein
MTAYHESPTGLILPHSANGSALSEAVSESLSLIAFQEARIADLEARLQEEGWLRLGESGGREFSRDALDQITENARAHYLKNPLVNRAVEIGALYVWGQDLTVGAADEGVKDVIDRFWRENRATLTGQQASRALEVELQVTGNVFLALFPDRVSGLTRVRAVPMEEIRAIVANPEDRYEPWYYKRCWNEQPLDGGQAVKREAYYPDWRYRPAAMPTSVNGIEVRALSPILHIRVGAFPHWRWGVSEVYAALDWAKAYKELLEDDATRSRALARFAWRLTTTGGAAGVAAAKTRLGTTLGAGGTGSETNPPPVAGSTFAGAALNPDHSRPVRLMTAAALGLPDHFFDADVGNYATSKTLDRPTELRYGERRQLWHDVFVDLVQWAIDRDIEAPGGLLRGTMTEEQRQVDVSFPDMLERSVTERVTAVIDAATLSGRTLAGTVPRETVARLLMVALGVDDIDGEVATLEDEWADQDERRSSMAQRLAQQPPAPDDDDVSREAFVRALANVQEVLRSTVASQRG